MKKIYLCLIFGGLFNSLFAEENFPAELYRPRVVTQVAPYVYVNLFQPGYGVSVRTQVSGHTFELAPMVMPPSAGHFGSSTKRMGLTCSYYYTFFKDKFFQPYLGCSYTHLRDLHRSTTWHYDGKNSEPYKITKDPIDQDNSISSLIGIQFCSPKGDKSRGFPGYLFVDVQGPIVFDRYGWDRDFSALPRIGAGLQF